MRILSYLLSGYILLSSCTPLSQALQVQPLSPLQDVGQANLVQYRGASIYGDSFPDFVLLYDPTVWRFVEWNDEHNDEHVDMLQAYRDESCRLILIDSPIQIYQIGEIVLGGQDWRLFDRGPHSLGYSTIQGPIPYIFHVNFAQMFDPSKPNACQLLAENVLATFTLAE